MIIVDTREQKPIWNPTSKNVICLKLDEGDYTTTSLLNLAHIERKSGSDLYGSIIQGHERFRNEILRANAKQLKLAIFVECSLDNFIHKNFAYGKHLKTPPSILEQIINTISTKYAISFIFCKNRKEFKSQALLWFENEFRKLT